MKRAVLEKLENAAKDYFSVSDLEKAFGIQRDSLYVVLSRLVSQGWLRRLGSGIYVLRTATPDLERIANQLCVPSYLSFESALARYGVISQLPYTIMFATTERTRRMQLAGVDIVYRRLKDLLFTGFRLKAGLFIAEPEKALLDLAYMVSLKQDNFDLNRLDFSKVSPRKISKWLSLYPKRTRMAVERLFD